MGHGTMLNNGYPCFTLAVVKWLVFETVEIRERETFG